MPVVLALEGRGKRIALSLRPVWTYTKFLASLGSRVRLCLKTQTRNQSTKKLSVQIVCVFATLHPKLILRENLVLKMIDHRPGGGGICL